ncbi:hypothetical protein L1049_009177 [Liquidambar formosana]|uniref:Cucumisin n=1 Tax=Liquidambar formosana TaxID=63359 RepID=A0AAP0X2R5_LIQFO
MDAVVSVFPSRNYKPQTTRSWDFMRFPHIVKRNRAVESDVVIGFIDTGIWPESDSFSDGGFSRPSKKWKGACNGGQNFTCNNKIIGARFYSSNTRENSARDTNGDGTHVASTAAGNKIHGTSFYGMAKGNARGAVPSARIAVYKVFWKGGCSSVDILAAFDDAINDQVDIISFSLGGIMAKGYKSDVIAIGSFHAMRRGILTSSAAGNAGPYPNSVTNVAPWMLTVEASTMDRKFIDEVILGDGTTLKPDITATGTDILAAWSPLNSPSGIPGDTRSVKYNIISGTSMAFPHATGAAAYVKTFHPNWSPAAIKSNLMTTASAMNDTKNPDGEFSYGSGHLNPAKAINPGLIYDAHEDDYLMMLCHLGDSHEVLAMTDYEKRCPKKFPRAARDLNYPSMASDLRETHFIRTVTNIGSANSIYIATVSSNYDVNITVSPEILCFKSFKEETNFRCCSQGDRGKKYG